MKKITLILLLFISNFSYSEEYILGAGDKVSIFVQGEEELSSQFLINNKGYINYPFIGKILAEGLTLDKLQDTLTSKLIDGYLVNPDLTVNIVKYRPYFILGEVEKPGSYEYQPGLTIKQAIAKAGGLKNRANTNSIKVERRNKTNSNEEIEILNLKLSEYLMPDDTITIPETFF